MQMLLSETPCGQMERQHLPPQTVIHENTKEAASDVFQELYGLQILLILPDPHMSFELEH